MLTKSLAICFALTTGSLLVVEAPQGKDAAKADASASQRSAQEFTIDGTHSSVVFRVVHLKAAPFWGRFNKVSGSFKIDDENLGDSFAKVEIPTDSVDTNSDRRDLHLKSQDFFNAKEHPKMTFNSTKVAKDGDAYEVTGDLTLRGVTKSVVAKVEHIGTGTVSPRFGLRSGYEATLVIKRTDFGMDFMTEGGALGDEVKIILGLEGMVPRGGR